MLFTPKTTCIVYIVAPAEKVWEALTNSELTKQYFFGRSVASDWKVGSRITYTMADGQVDVQGIIKECEKAHLLSLTWHVEWLEEYRKLPDALVTFQIDALRDVVRLTMTESHQWEITDALLEGGRKGWPVILSGLKTLLETGKPMPLPDFPE